MMVVYSPKGIINDASPRRGVAAMERAGLKNILMDFSMKIDDSALKKQPDMRFPIAIAPRRDEYGERTEGNEAEDEDALFELSEKCICSCEEIGCEYLIVPALPAKCYQRLAAIAGEKGITLLLKNECRDINGHLVRGNFCDARETAEFLEGLLVSDMDVSSHLDSEVDVPPCLNSEAFAFCLDVGVCNLCGQNLYEFILTLGNRVKAVILRDNDGRMDGSFFPFTNVGSGGMRTDWRGLILGLRKIKFDGMIIFDFQESIRVVPGALRPRYLQLAKDMGAYFEWQLGQELVLAKYKTRVLFGAGNMCRNYMRCYGAEFPPLFTCDNNSRLWDTEIAGLVVKNPEELKKLPKDCAIFICNIYYDEIERQLQEMGLENPIEFFNDEWMWMGGNDA